MAKAFDPYHKWLGIPPQEQPPNLYRLLGITVFESDPDVIDAAANRQMTYVQGCATGTHLAESQKLLNELAAARVCLLDRKKKAAYDAHLKARQSAAKPAAKPATRPAGKPAPLPKTVLAPPEPAPRPGAGAGGFPCPNPTCSHVFPPASVSGAASLNCPRCGTVFQFRPGAGAPASSPRLTPAAAPAQRVSPPAAPAAYAGVPQGAPVAPIPMAAPVAPAQEPPVVVFTPVPEDELALVPAAADEEAPSPALRKKRRRRRGLGGTIVLWAVLLAALGAMGYGGYYVFQNYLGSEGGQLAGKKHVSRQFNYSFVIPNQPWKADEELKPAVGANLLALRRTNPNVWMALAARDYQTRSPREGEAVDEAVNRLGGYFKPFEWEQKEDVKLGGQRAQRIVFQGEANHVPMTGECYILIYKGIAYWFATWAPNETVDVAAETFDKLHKRFALLNEREGWAEKRPPVKTFPGKAAPYQLRDTEGIWEKWPTPADEDPLADLALHGKDRTNPEDVDKMARVLVLVLKPQPDLEAAVKEARAHLEEQQKKEYPETTMEVLTDKDGPLDRPGQVGEAQGHVVKLQVKNGDTRTRYVLLAVVRTRAHALAIQCECDLKRRSLWERDFTQLLRTFTLRGK